MNMRKNAWLTPLGRERIVRQVASGQTPQVADEPQASARGPFGSGPLDSNSVGYPTRANLIDAPDAAEISLFAVATS